MHTILGAFSFRTLQESKVLLEWLKINNISSEEFLIFMKADFIVRGGRVVARRIKRRRRRRTPEERTDRKKALEEAEYGSIKVKP